MFVMGEPSRATPGGAPSEVWRPWYWTQRWKRRRAQQLRAQPFCAFCLEQTGVYTLATIADHIEPHRGDVRKFWFGDLQSLCETHHKRDKRLIEAGRPLLGVDDDGWPR